MGAEDRIKEGDIVQVSARVVGASDEHLYVVLYDQDGFPSIVTVRVSDVVVADK